MSVDDLVGQSSADPFEGKSIEEVIAFCRANGIHKLNYKGLSLEFSANPSGAATQTPESLMKFAQSMAGAVPSDTEMLGWSAPEFPADLAELANLIGMVPTVPPLPETKP